MLKVKDEAFYIRSPDVASVALVHTNSSPHTAPTPQDSAALGFNISAFRFYIKPIVPTLASLSSFICDLDDFHSSTSGPGTLGSFRRGGGLGWAEVTTEIYPIAPLSGDGGALFISWHTGTMGMREAWRTNIPHCLLSNCCHLLLQTHFHIPGLMVDMRVYFHNNKVCKS